MASLQRVEVPGYPFAIAAARGALWAEVMVGTSSERRMEIMRLDDGRWRSTAWSGRISHVRMWSHGGATWVRCGTVVRCIDDEAFALDIAAAVEPGETIHAVRMLDGDAIVVCAQPRRHTTVRAVDARGRLRWARPLHAAPDVLGRSHRRPVDVGPSYGSELAVTAGLAVACVEDSLSGIALCFGVATSDGAVCWMTAPGPISGLTELEPGTIAIRRHGYGWFEISAWRSDGERTHWPSDGLPVRLGDTWFAAEHVNDLSALVNWARWNTDGTVDRGPRLPGYYTTPPVAVAGCAYFARRNDLWCARADLSADVVAQVPEAGPDPDPDPSWRGSAVSEDGTVYLARASRDGSSAIWLVRP
jgi:hypothetical protein